MFSSRAPQEKTGIPQELRENTGEKTGNTGENTGETTEEHWRISSRGVFLPKFPTEREQFSRHVPQQLRDRCTIRRAKCEERLQVAHRLQALPLRHPVRQVRATAKFECSTTPRTLKCRCRLPQAHHFHACFVAVGCSNRPTSTPFRLTNFTGWLALRAQLCSRGCHQLC